MTTRAPGQMTAVSEIDEEPEMGSEVEPEDDDSIKDLLEGDDEDDDLDEDDEGEESDEDDDDLLDEDAESSGDEE